MNSKISGSRVKGFTLVEMLIVIAIIAILAGSISLFVAGFQRDARIETNNNKARMVYTAFQNILINCEIEQDDSAFDLVEPKDSDYDGILEYALFQFSMSDAKVDDIITVRPQYVAGDSGSVAHNLKDYYVDRNSADAATKERFELVEKAITSYLDSSFEGTAIVYVNYKNYVVDSVLYFEPNVIDKPSSGETKYFADNVSPAISKLMSDGYVETEYREGCSYPFPILKSLDEQKKYYKYVGSNLGAYPLLTDYVDDKII